MGILFIIAAILLLVVQNADEKFSANIHIVFYGILIYIVVYTGILSFAK